MTGWWIVISGCICAVGVLILLTLVSNELRRVELAMASFEQIEKRAARRRKKRLEKEASLRAEEKAAAMEESTTDDSTPIVPEVVAMPGRVAAPDPGG